MLNDNGLDRTRDKINEVLQLDKVVGTDRWTSYKKKFLSEISHLDYAAPRNNSGTGRESLLDARNEKNAPNNCLLAQRRLNSTEEKYYILTFGQSSSFADSLPQGEKITVSCNGKNYQGNVHKTTTGRIDSLGLLYRQNKELKENADIEAIYYLEKRLMELKVI